MSKLRTIKENVDGIKIVAFYCEGCKEEHQVWVNAEKNTFSSTWSWNGSMDKPTFAPSILIRSGHYAPHHVKAMIVGVLTMSNTRTSHLHLIA